jgi:hypothetical protein
MPSQVLIYLKSDVFRKAVNLIGASSKWDKSHCILNDTAASRCESKITLHSQGRLNWFQNWRTRLVLMNEMIVLIKTVNQSHTPKPVKKRTSKLQYYCQRNTILYTSIKFSLFI